MVHTRIFKVCIHPRTRRNENCTPNVRGKTASVLLKTMTSVSSIRLTHHAYLSRSGCIIGSTTYCIRTWTERHTHTSSSVCSLLPVLITSLDA
eukprot:6601657-Pyramimonas_sp.AAC.1